MNYDYFIKAKLKQLPIQETIRNILVDFTIMKVKYEESIDKGFISEDMLLNAVVIKYLNRRNHNRLYLNDRTIHKKAQ